MPALTQTSSLSPPGAPETPTAPIVSSPIMIGNAPRAAVILARKSCPATGFWPISRPRAARCRRSEEHTSELQSHLNPVCRLLLEKKQIGREFSYEPLAAVARRGATELRSALDQLL